MPSETSSIAQLIQEMVDQQLSKVLKVARELVADATPEDIRNPQDFPELSTDALFNYEDGILTGYLSMQTALRSQEKMKAMILNELCGLEKNHASLELPELSDRIPSENEILFNKHIPVQISGGRANAVRLRSATKGVIRGIPTIF